MARVLYIGADGSGLGTVRHAMEEGGHELLVASDERQGLEAASAQGPALILLDLPTTSYEAASRLRSRAALDAVPIVLLSDREDRALALALGCEGWLEKPIEAEGLRRKVDAALEGKRERTSDAEQRRQLMAYTQGLAERLAHQVDKLTRANERLRLADDLKNRILENVSDQLATPLTPLLGYLELLESGRLGPLTTRQRRAVLGVQHSVRRLAVTVDRLIDLASLQDASTPVELVPMDVLETAREARAALEPKARNRHIRLDLNAPPGTVSILGDPDRLRQAFIHLLDNALRFTPRGGFVLLDVRPEPGRVQVSFYDSGEPISEEEQAQLFEPFARTGRRSTSDSPPPDLELALSRRIAQSHGGTVEVESPPRALPERTEAERQLTGARITMTLPRADGGARAP